jgi:hypothetical protein
MRSRATSDAQAAREGAIARPRCRCHARGKTLELVKLGTHKRCDKHAFAVFC